MTTDEAELTISRLETEIENLQHAAAVTFAGIVDACVRLGHDGGDIADLRDAVGQIKRLLDGNDLTDEFEGIAERVRVLVAASPKRSL